MTPSPPLALAARSLRLDARSSFIHLLRSCLAAFLLITLIGVYLTKTSYGAPGLNLYNAVITIDFLFVGVLGVALFATAISEEREEGSLGLMRMAGLNPLGILVGKSLSLLTVSLSLLAIQLPFMMFAVTLGGVSPHQIMAGFVILGGFLLFAYGVGLLCSTVCRTGIVASRMTLAILIVANLWPFLVQALLAAGKAMGLLGSFVIPIKPLAAQDLAGLTAWGALTATSETNYAGQLLGTATSIHICAAVLCFVGAWLLFNFVENRAGKETTSRKLFGLDSWGGVSRVPRFSGNALVWKDYRLFVGGRRGMILRFILYGIGMLVLAWFNNPFGPEFERHLFGERFLTLLAVGIVLDLGSLAGRVFRDEIAWQTYSTLLLLPKSVLQISYGKVMGCLTAVFPALCYMVIATLCCKVAVIIAIGPLLFAFVSLLYLLLPLIVYTSLWLPRGAFPLTIFAFITLAAGLYLMFTSQTGAGVWCMLGLILLVTSWIFSSKIHRKILARLRDLSGCDI